MVALVFGSGVEDARHPAWGHVVRHLGVHFTDVFPFDHIKANVSGRRSEYQTEWVLERFERPHIFLIASDPERDAQLKSQAETLGLEVKEVNFDGASPDARGFFDPFFEVGDSVERAWDVGIFGTATPAKANQLSTAVQQGLNAHAWGEGWSKFPKLLGFTSGSPFYPARPAVYGAVKSVIVNSDYSEDLIAKEAFASGCEVVTEIGTAYEPSTAVDKSGLGLVSLAPVTVTVTKDGPKFTVMLGAYNIAEYIGEAIESILNQTYDDLELLVVDDGSVDQSRSVIERYLGDPRLRLVHQPNIGQTGRFDLLWRTLGREHRGEYVVNMGGDDRALPHRLERIAATFTEDPGIGVLHSAGIAISDKGQRIAPFFALEESYDDSSFLRTIIRSNAVAHPTVAHRWDLYDQIGELEDGFAADHSFWLKAANVARFRYLPEALVEYRLHDKSASNSKQNQAHAASEMTRISEAGRARYSISDLYPSLKETSVSVDFAAAYVDLATGFLTVNGRIDQAIEELDKACAVAPEVRNALTEAFEAIDREMGAESIKRLLPSAESISIAPFKSPRGSISWDGSLASLNKILCVPNWSISKNLAKVIEAYVSVYSPGDEVELVLPTIGLPTDFVLQTVAQNLPPGLDLSQAAAITIEQIDSVELLHRSRYAMVIDATPQANMDVDQVQQRMRQLRSRLFD